MAETHADAHDLGDLSDLGTAVKANDAPGAEAVSRVVSTPEALALVERLEGEHGPLLFHQSGGCCDGSAPMCFSRTEFFVGNADVYLGDIGDTPFYMGAAQFAYWAHTQLIIDVVPGNGGMFSLERPTGMRFLTRSRLFTDAENAWLDAHPVAVVP